MGQIQQVALTFSFQLVGIDAGRVSEAKAAGQLGPGDGVILANGRPVLSPVGDEVRRIFGRLNPREGKGRLLR